MLDIQDIQEPQALIEQPEAHFKGEVPLIEYQNNKLALGDYELQIPLIDAYNILESDRVNDKEQFVDAFLFLTGIDLDSEQAKKLKEERILMGYEGAAAQYLSKVMSESDIEVLKDSLKSDIHKALKQRFELYVNFLSLKGAMEYVPIHRIDVVFTRNLPVNELEISQMVNNLVGIASSETLLSQLSFVGDPKEEAQLAAKEKMLGEKLKYVQE